MTELTDSDREQVPPITEASILAPSPSVRFRRIETEAVLLDLERGHYFRLNETGVAIWQGVERGLALGALRDELAHEFGADPGVVWSDLSRLVEELLAEKLVLPHEPRSG